MGKADIQREVLKGKEVGHGDQAFDICQCLLKDTYWNIQKHLAI